MKKRGFTLIELLVVIAIIGVLSSVVLASLNTARAKARDAKRISDFRSVSIALNIYFDKYNKYPNESAVVTNRWVDNFNSMAQQLVSEGFLTSVPVDPGGSSYSYYNYGGSTGGLLVTYIESAPSNTTGLSPSCRPFGNNWCSSTIASKAYCICNPY